MDTAEFWQSFQDTLPALVKGVILILIAWLVAVLVKNVVTKGFKKIKLDERLVKWKMFTSTEQADNLLDSLGKICYYLIWLVFLPGIFTTFGLNSIASPITDMMNYILQYLPNILLAAVILTIGILVAKLVKNLVYNLASTLKVDHYVDKFVGTSKDEENKESIAKSLAMICYLLVLLPIAVVALEALKISTITKPIVTVLNSILSAIPNILVAAILLTVGIVIAKVAGNLVTSLLENTGIDKMSASLYSKEKVPAAKISKILGQTIAVVVSLFFVVEALGALKFKVLDHVGEAIIGYLPNLLFAVIILGLGFFGGQFVGKMLTNATKNKWLGFIIQVVFGIFAVFMALDQLDFANSIVNIAFLFIVGGLSVAFAVAFGLGGRDFAHHQLEKLDKKLDDEGKDKEE
ncbi:mechanosensitive ion channel [Ligilactobacillus acidipiscis]|uniref:Cell division protein FtsW n=1 Tax=Ligilactobacillus acidipiscis TaxID=89059 RepID=A0A1K1KRP2_9LACO|nr:mechanosensitive ion channel [Ligilactobacillus acidipiscis]SFV41517.1 Cell division protein FtsW [Ligilactobacillus acidipiscis]